MNLIIQGCKTFSVSDSMKSTIEEKVLKFDYFKENIKEIDFRLDKEKFVYKVDVTMITHKLGTFRFTAEDEDMYNAIDKVIHKVDEKIHREKEKMHEHASNREEYVESLAENVDA